MKSTNARILKTIALSFLVACPAMFAGSKDWVILEHGKFVGFTDKARQTISKFRDAYRARKEAFKKEFKGYETIDHAIDVVRLMHGNLLLHGGPGGGKTYALFKKLQSEPGRVFDIQMNQMMSEHPFVGGQNFDAARQGKYEVNIDGSLCDSTVGIIDEAHNANPAALAALMSILNERQVKAGNKVINCPIETVFFTLNQNPYELEQQFAENGQRATAQALMNRFTVKAFVPNWLSKVDQTALDDQYIEDLDAWYFDHNGHFDWTNKFDWNELTDLAKVLLRPTQEFNALSRDVMHFMRSQTIDQVEAVKATTKNGYGSEEVLPYAATAQLSERLRQKIVSVVMASIVLDLLESPLVDDITRLETLLKNMPNNRFGVGPLSLWRAYMMLTTISFGKTSLNFPLGADGKRSVDLQFGNFFDEQDAQTKQLIYKPLEKREEQMIVYIKDEQKRFKDAFTTFVAHHKSALEDMASFDAVLSCLNDNAKAAQLNDIERLLFALKQKRS